MLLGVIADDFTGASDIANTLARGHGGTGGLATTQFLGIPAGAASPDCEAGVVALKSRSIAAPLAVSQSLAALEWLEAQGCRQFIFKYCSTFDSTPAGNIGPVGEALAKKLGVSGVSACPAFPAAGRTVFNGHLFVGDRLLSETSMRTHPLNPMTDSDLRRWLRLQTQEAVGLVAHAVVARGGDAIRQALAACAAQGERMAIVDAVSEADLIAIAAASRDARLLTGGSGIALGLPANFIGQGLARGRPATLPKATGPEAILAGSCSARTLEQVELHRKSHPVMAIEPQAVLEGKVAPQDAVTFVLVNAGRAPLVFSTAPADAVGAVQRRYGREAVAHAIERFFAEAARALVDAGVTRLVVAGGETSGAVVSALGLGQLAIGPEIAAGVPILFSEQGSPLVLALKSGNFGQPDFFARALGMMSGR
ncbi:MAG TPA: 3-oxo-tetronate kinase [Usitatibacter sp.]|nr:3-oxo-tetronate kinase [Usitatibacter sp.]